MVEIIYMLDSLFKELRSSDFAERQTIKRYAHRIWHVQRSTQSLPWWHYVAYHAGVW